MLYEELKIFAEEHFDMPETWQSRTTIPLLWAAALGIPSVCAWLIEQGGDVNYISNVGTPPCAVGVVSIIKGYCYSVTPESDFIEFPTNENRIEAESSLVCGRDT